MNGPTNSKIGVREFVPPENSMPIQDLRETIEFAIQAIYDDFPSTAAAMLKKALKDHFK